MKIVEKTWEKEMKYFCHGKSENIKKEKRKKNKEMLFVGHQ